MKFGLVSVLYNSASFLNAFLDCVQGQTYADFILYCVDNASRDASAEMVSARLSDTRVRLIKNDANLGVATANNQGIEAALRDRCDYVLFCNNDMTFGEDVLASLAEKAIEYPDSMLAPKILFGDGMSVYYAGGRFSRMRGVPWHFRYALKDRPENTGPKAAGYAGTAFLAVPSETAKRVRMDERYFVYLDDPDFVIRARRMGTALYYLPDIVILHFASSSTGGRYSDFTLRYVTRNTVYFLRKNYPRLGGFYAFVFVLRTALIWMKVDADKKKIIAAALAEGFAMGKG
jgi:GT2 family glycosyltransferase